MSSLARNKYTVCATIIGLFLAYKLFIERKSSKDSKKKDTFTIVLLSDIHNSINNIKKVKAYIDKNGINVDGLFMPGDFLNLKGNDYKDSLKIKESKSDLKSLFRQAKMIFNKPVVLPGNHDPDLMFDGKHKDIYGCTNVHNDIIQMDDDLYVTGFGGSVPAFINDEQVWKGYPFMDENEFNIAFNEYAQRLIQHGNEHKDAQYILLTHIGPTHSSTVVDWRHNDINKRIQSGSITITKLLLNSNIQDKIICNIHGHTHLGVGLSWIGNTPIINPGSLKDSNEGNKFGILKIKRNTNGYKMDETHFKNIDP